MMRRRTVVVLGLAGACLAVAAALLGATGTTGWRLRATAASAAALFVAGILQARVNTVLDRRRQDRAELEQGIFMPERRAPLVRDITDPVSVRVHAAALLDGSVGAGGRVPPYVPRDVDPVLNQALARSGFVLLVGAAAAGKTRTGYEAIRMTLPGHVFIAPGRAADVPAAMMAARGQRDCVLWLDNLQRYLGADVITTKGIAELLAGEGHHRVVVATLRAVEESLLIAAATSLAGEQLTRGGQAVLDLVTHRIVVHREFSEPELSRAAGLAANDPRLADAVVHADRYGVAEYLSSGPQLYTEWNNAWERGTHPRGAALVAAAVDCRRAGFAAPLPRALLNELCQAYLDQRGGMRLRPEPPIDAWTWATELRDSGSSLLWPVGNDVYDVFDYLVDAWAREPGQPVTDAMIRIALRFAGPADASAIATTACYQDRPELAEAGFRSAYNQLRETEGPDAPAALASRSDLAVTLHALGRLPDAETEYRAILARRTAALGAEHPDTLASRNNLAVFLHDQRRLDEAKAEYGAILNLRMRTLGAEHPSTMLIRNNLGVVLKDLGRFGEAEAELEEAVRLRTRILGADHPHTAISRKNLDTVRRELSAG